MNPCVSTVWCLGGPEGPLTDKMLTDFTEGRMILFESLNFIHAKLFFKISVNIEYMVVFS